MMFIWSKTEKTTSLELGSHVVGLFRDGVRPDKVVITEEEIIEAKIDGHFSHNPWELERYIANNLRKCLKEGGIIEVTSGFSMKLHEM